LPSKPPVLSGEGASSAGFCLAGGGAVVTALMKGASFAEGWGLSALALHPERPRESTSAQMAAQKDFLDVKFIY
jgi:hypothetical protein